MFHKFLKLLTRSTARENRHKVLDKWSLDMRRSHPCPLCLKEGTWLGKLCDKCQEKLDIWCPCDAETIYSNGHVPLKRAPLPDLICCEYCNRCGMRIKPIWLLMEETDSTENDAAIDKLIDRYEIIAHENGDV